MKKTPAIIITLVCVSSFLLMRCANPNVGNGSDVGNARISSMLYNPGGTPAANAKVCFYAHENDPRPGKGAGAVDSTTTDANGNYTAKLDSGTYNILATLGDKATFQDSIRVYKDSIVQPPADTLKALGGISGKIELQGNDDPRTVFILFMGSNAFTMVKDTLGNFSATNMAKGKYLVRILTTLDNYKVMDTSFTITAGVDSVIPKPIQLEYTGIPVPQGLKIAYDTLKQIVTLIWNKPINGRAVQSYTIYRKRIDSATFVSIKSGVKDTIYSDSTGVQDQTYEYRVAVVDTNGTEGVKSAMVTVTVASAWHLLKTIDASKITTNLEKVLGSPVSRSIYLLSRSPVAAIFHLDSNGTVVDSFGTGSFSNPYDMTRDSLGNFYIADGTLKQIDKFDSIGTRILQWSTDYACNSITIMDTIIVVGTTSDVEIFGWNGLHFSSFAYKEPISGISIGSDGNLFVYGSKTISKISTTGAVLDSIFNTDLSYLPTYNSNGYIVNFDSHSLLFCLNNMFYIIDENGQFLSKVDPKGIPSKMYVYQNLVWVADITGLVRIFQK